MNYGGSHVHHGKVEHDRPCHGRLHRSIAVRSGQAPLDSIGALGGKFRPNSISTFLRSRPLSAVVFEGAAEPHS